MQEFAIGVSESQENQKAKYILDQIKEVVNRQLIAKKNNYKEVYKSFYEIVEIIQNNY